MSGVQILVQNSNKSKEEKGEAVIFSVMYCYRRSQRISVSFGRPSSHQGKLLGRTDEAFLQLKLWTAYRTFLDFKMKISYFKGHCWILLPSTKWTKVVKYQLQPPRSSNSSSFRIKVSLAAKWGALISESLVCTTVGPSGERLYSLGWPCLIW